MKNILVLDSSAAREGSISRELVDYAVARLAEAAPQARVIRRDLDADPLPHIESKNLAGVRGVPATDIELATRMRSDALIAELRAADTIVIGAPMYNFGIPTVLRGWFDYVLRAGETFSYSAAGPRGLLGNKRVIVIEARGGLYSEGPAQVIDFQEPYLRHLLGFMGLTDVAFIRAERIGFGPEARSSALEDAKGGLRELIAGPLASAA